MGKLNHTGGIRYNRTKDIEVVPGCNSIIITNLGGCIVYVDQNTLFPNASPSTAAGDSITYGGHEDDLLDITKVRIRFEAGGANPLVEIDQFFYKQ